MNLKRKPKVDDSWQHCCRWCHYYIDGKCQNSDVVIQVENSSFLGHTYDVAESGRLSGVLEETLNDRALVNSLLFEAEKILDKWNISQKRKVEFEIYFRKCWPKFAVRLKETLDEQVSILYENELEHTDLSGKGCVEISEPEDYCCKYWR